MYVDCDGISGFYKIVVITRNKANCEMQLCGEGGGCSLYLFLTFNYHCNYLLIIL